MVPVVHRPQSLQLLLQRSPHAVDAIGHPFALRRPFLAQIRIGECTGNDTSAVNGRVGVHWADEDLKLAFQPCRLISVSCDDRESTHSLSVQSKVLSETLSNRHRNPTVCKLANA